MTWRCRVEFEAIPWQQPVPGVREKVALHGDVKLRLVEYSQNMAPHWCAKGHAGQILDGRFEIRFEGHVEILNAGDAVLIPAGDTHKHMARALTETVTALFVEANELIENGSLGV